MCNELNFSLAGSKWNGSHADIQKALELSKEKAPFDASTFSFLLT
jgi:hypothetical protein